MLLPFVVRHFFLEGPSSKRKPVIHTLKDAIEEAGLTEKAVVYGRYDLSRLDNKERVSLLDFIGQEIGMSNTFDSLSSTARAYRGVPFQELDLLSTPSSTRFPVIGTEDLFVRQAYKDLYQEIMLKFLESPRNRGWKRMVVTGTSGIGKSAFLVYFTIRLLAASSDDNPSIVVFHEKGGSKCYVFGGVSTLRYGDIEDFRPFLDLRETWYLVDSAPRPQLVEAKTIISVSPKTLYSEVDQYQEIDKRVPWRYYMAPWILEELEQCRGEIRGFQAVSKEFMEQLYDLIGGVPRYVLEKPKDVLSLDPDDLAGAKDSAYERVRQAIDSVKDPLKLMQCFRQGKDSLEFSSRLLHRWPSDDHKNFRLEWASAHVAEEVSKSLQDAAWKSILKSLVTDGNGAAKGVMFETYVQHIFRKGDCQFQIKNLEDGTVQDFDIPANPRVGWFKEIPALSAGSLQIPKQCNYACVDLLLAPRHLFQITVSKKHDIKGPPFSDLLDDLIRQNWIGSSGEAQLIFVVPTEIYKDFRAQKYLTSAGDVYKRLPKQIRRVKQFVLNIDLESASTGQSPGKRGSAY